MKVVTAAEMQEIDGKAINEFGVPSLILMENAGLQVAKQIIGRYPDLPCSPVGIFAGKGNNGGDSFVVARHLANRHLKVVVFVLAGRDNLRGDAKTNFDIIEKMGLEIYSLETHADLLRWQDRISAMGILVDGVLGTGCVEAVKGYYGEVIAFLNALKKPIVSIDVPSGLSCDHGAILGEHVRADLTVTLGLPKRAQFLYPAANAFGKTVVADIGIPSGLLRDAKLTLNVTSPDQIRGLLPVRPPDAHKGSAGHVVVLAGSVGKTGAAALASIAALRIGAGLVTLGIPESLNAILENKLTEVMTSPLPETREHTLDIAAKPKIMELLHEKDALVIGPGLSTHPQTCQLVRELAADLDMPTVFDADGINSFVSHLHLLKGRSAPFIFTPHPGEMARLLHLSTAALLERRLDVVTSFAQDHGMSIALKGAHTLVVAPNGEAHFNDTGNAGLATAGTGDVLSGVIGGLLAQGLHPPQALLAGVYIHGLAGDMCRVKFGPVGMIAGDLLEFIPLAMREVKEEAREKIASHDIISNRKWLA